MANGAKVYQGFLDRGFSPVHAAVLAGNFQQESGFNPSAYNPKEDAFGGLQWRLNRKTGLENYAKSTGRDPSDIDAQMDWVVKEMTSDPYESRQARAFLAATDLAGANKALKNYVRYGDDSEGARLEFAGKFSEGQPQGISMAQGQGEFVNPAFPGGFPDLTGGQFSPPQSGASAPQAAPHQQPPSLSDDELLRLFMPSGVADGGGAGASELSDDDLLRQFMVTPEGAAEAESSGQSSMPWLDPLSAAANSLIEAIPIVGPKIREMTDYLDALTYGESPEARAAFNRSVQENQPVASAAGGVVGTVGPYVAAGAVPALAKGLGMSGNLLTRMGMGGASSAGIETIDTLARGGSMEDAGRNALMAGAVGAGAAPVADLIGKGVNKLLAGPPKEVAELAKIARDEFNIPIGPGQLASNPTVRFADSTIGKLPGSGGTTNAAAQQTAFNRAVAKTFGESADALTPEVMSRAKDRLGGIFDRVAAKTEAIPLDAQSQSRLASIITDARLVVTEQEVEPLAKQIAQITGLFEKGDGSITGEAYQALTHKDAPLDRLINSPNPNIRHYARQIRETLDDALQRAAPPEIVSALQNARAQYKAMKTIEPIVEKAATGDVSAPLLMGAVRNSYGDIAYGGGGDLAKLAKIGQRFLKQPPSSGTAERSGIMHALNQLTGPAMAGGLMGVPAALGHAIPGVAAYSALVPLAGKALRSEKLTNRLIENALGGSRAGASRMVNRLTRGGVPVVQDKEGPVDITVRGGNPLLRQ